VIRPIENIKTKERITQLKDVSRRRLEAGERVVERSFHKARLLVTLAAGLLLVGFLLVAQWRGNATLTASPERQSDQNLAIIIGQLTTENSALRSEIMRLETRILDAERETKDRSQVFNDAAQELRALRMMTGIEPAVGPGVIVRLVDPERVLLPQDFVALVNELRAAGAEAVAVNDVRVDARAGFTGQDGVIRLGDAVLSREFEVVAIGDPANLEQSLTLPGGLKSTLSTFPGVSVTVERSERLHVPAAREPVFEIGEPVEE
jgi:uncharacterized protein YlxW (UPF0749 family)